MWWVVSPAVEEFIKIFNEDNHIGHLIETDVPYTEKLNELHNVYPFWLKEWKFTQFKNLDDKEKYVIHIRNLKQALNHRVVF